MLIFSANRRSKAHQSRDHRERFPQAARLLFGQFADAVLSIEWPYSSLQADRSLWSRLRSDMIAAT
jgi:hypothetical protein